MSTIHAWVCADRTPLFAFVPDADEVDAVLPLWRALRRGEVAGRVWVGRDGTDVELGHLVWSLEATPPADMSVTARIALVPDRPAKGTDPQAHARDAVVTGRCHVHEVPVHLGRKVW